jgi:type IV pilus assembly protein PilB
MSDVDAIRWMASEHDLEFVDLDTYGVDPAAGEILPADLSRLHHVVAIKRKFGTPVIATADPDDISAQESVRASIGRDFISVVASSEQISEYLDQLFGPEEAEEVPVNTDFAGAQGEGAADGWEPASFNGLLDDGISSATDSEELALADPSVPDSGKRRAKRSEVRQKGSKGASNPKAESSEDTDLSPEADSQVVSSDRPFSGVIGGIDWIDTPEFEEQKPALDGDPIGVDAPGTPLGQSPEGAITDPIDPAADQQAVAAPLEPATSLLPAFGADVVTPDFPSSASQGGGPVDPLAALAQSVQEVEQQYPDDDSTTLAADLVAEAVATFQEQQGEEHRSELAGLESASGTSLFPPLAKFLVDGERVSLQDMEAVLEEHYQTGQSIARILTAEGLVTEADLMWGMAQEMGLEFVDLDTVGVDYAEAGSIPEATARHHNVIVIANDDGTPVVAASNPTDVFAMDDLRTIMGRSFIVVVATRTQISHYIGQVFNSGGDAADMAMEASLGFDGSGSDNSVDDIQAVTEEAPIVRYVNLLILQALNERASDIHVEPTATDLRIRYRIDGVLHDVSTAPRAISAAVTTRLKVMADMNVAEHRIPQDGRISLNVGSKGIDLRMATLPTIHGEKVVMRVLDKSSVVLGFPDLGFDDDFLRTYESIYTKPYGTILVTGPTGSGKSTTLYTTLTALNSPEKNIITVEDPVELQLKGVNQVQLNVKAGLTFASALRSILRSDPDIVLVGEIRDKETAVIAIEAALTGHMVLATLHTNSAAATPMRLIEMGLEPFLVTSSLSGVLAQRLARRLCMHCKEAYEPTEADITAAGWTLEEVEAIGGMPKVYRAIGCSACANTGYRGRKALAELLPMTEEIERLIIEGGSVDDIHKLAVAQGMLTLRQSGLRKAIEGETTLEEVLRVVA